MGIERNTEKIDTLKDSEICLTTIEIEKAAKADIIKGAIAPIKLDNFSSLAV